MNISEYEIFIKVQNEYLFKIKEWMRYCNLKGDSIKYSMYGCIVLRNQISLNELDNLMFHVKNGSFMFINGNVLFNLSSQMETNNKDQIFKLFGG